MVDPDATLEELRELYMQSRDDDLPDAAYVLDLFYALDTWMVAGMTPPKEWRQ